MTVVTAGLADQIVAAALSVPGVIGLDGGSRGEAETHLLGRCIRGVHINEYERVGVHIVVAYGSAVSNVAEDVRVAVCRLVQGPVDVCVENVVDRGESLAA
ncbi:Asp23/Gls24 family envelope stress response protein [Tomitella biformata]|uniref:Asp23/Gls24 family envelope stress response protein n=1 Tax=Tomitella biformata TaxID=630403 RepID=UPI000465CC30|nr:Asp23/Gls24 family envelope stress response protein [Tomitella biformata]